jgi:UDP-GlcNAc:undecaprenyl-phosphate GlcNAc-1-phosphate transferase
MPMTAIIGALGALILSLAFTPLIAWASRRCGYVVPPCEDRWHEKPTAMFGGVGIFLAVMIPFAALHDYDPGILFVLAGATIVFGLGIVDDLYHVQPYTKLVVQIAAASLVTFGALDIAPEGWTLLLIPLAIFWLVALTNAFNLLDNMDGLSSGTACIAAFFLFVIAYSMQSWTVVLCAALLFGSTLGFLVYNFHPARIFMGDSGSMFLGFTLAALAMKGSWEQATNLGLIVLIPVLVLAVPIFDTTFVTLVRWMNGRAISEGGRDHTSHRLVAFGLSQRKTVALFYLISLVCGSIALLGVWYNALLPSLLGTIVVLVCVFFGMFLSGIVTYGTESEVRERAGAGRGMVLDIFLMHKRRILEVLVDVVLICLAYVTSFVIRFDGGIPPDHYRVLVQSLQVILPLKLLVFASFGLYSGIWRYVGMRDLIAIIKAVSLSSVLAIAAMTMLFRFELLPRSAFVIDWMALLLLVAGVRFLIRGIREYLFGLSDTKGKRVAIVGAGDAGEIVLRELRNNARLQYVPVGFFDDDPLKQGRRIHGVPILGGRDTIVATVERLGIDQIMVAVPSARPASLAEIIRVCESTGVPVTVMPSLADLIQGGGSMDLTQGKAGTLPPRIAGVGKEHPWH